MVDLLEVAGREVVDLLEVVDREVVVNLLGELQRDFRKGFANLPGYQNEVEV